MWGYEILNALYFFIYRLLQLFGILVSILFIPFSVLIAFSTLNLKDAVAYSLYISHSRLNRLRTFSFTLRLTIDNYTPKVNLQHYDDDTADASKRINEMKFSSIRTCIIKSFQEARRYSYVIFQTNNAAGKFIQLRMDSGIYIVELPLTPYTLNREYAIDFIKLLRTQGLTKTQPNMTYRNKTYSIETINPDLTVVHANLGRNMNIATDFCSNVFTKIFKTNAIPEIIVG